MQDSEKAKSHVKSIVLHIRCLMHCENLFSGITWEIPRDQQRVIWDQITAGIKIAIARRAAAHDLRILECPRLLSLRTRSFRLETKFGLSTMLLRLVMHRL
jgi:hypothetical protein